MSPLTAKPWLHPAKYSLWYPGANFPPPRMASACDCASRGNALSTSQLLMSSGALDTVAYFWDTLRKQSDSTTATDLKIVWNYETRGVRDHRDFQDPIECQIKNIARWTWCEIGCKWFAILASETKPSPRKSDCTILLERSDNTIDNWAGLGRPMGCRPFLAIETGLWNVSVSAK